MTALRGRPTESETKTRNAHSCPRRRLQSSRDKLTRRLEQLEADLNTTPDIEGDDPDPLIQEKTRNFALAQQFENQLVTIDRALQQRTVANTESVCIAVTRSRRNDCECCRKPRCAFSVSAGRENRSDARESRRNAFAHSGHLLTITRPVGCKQSYTQTIEKEN